MAKTNAMARAAHDLGLAGWFGGLAGVLALNARMGEDQRPDVMAENLRD